MKLSNLEFENLLKALLDAYRNYDKLKLMVRMKLGEKLELLSKESDLEIVVFHVIEWAESQDKILDLILGAYEKNPDNSEMKKITAQLLNRIIENEENYIACDGLAKRLHEVVNKLNLSINNSVEKSEPQNQQQLNFEHIAFSESICQIDFQEAIQTFKNIQSQFNEDGDTVLFLIEENLMKKGDLCLQILRDDLKSNAYRQHFCYCPVTYTPGNLEGVVQGIANFFGVKPEKMNINQHINLLIEKIGDSLQNNSVVFIEINCVLSDPSEIDPLIPWFINHFWQLLGAKIKEITKNYSGIQVIAVIISDLLIEQNLSCYCNKEHTFLKLDKLVKIPLDNWTKEDIAKWLIKYGNPMLKKNEKEKLTNQIYNATGGVPIGAYFALQQQWDTLTRSPTSC